MGETDRSAFFPCLLTIQRDPSVIGRPRLEYVVHEWGEDPWDHVREDLIRDASDYPIPLATVEQMDDPHDDFYLPGVPRFCETCFPDRHGDDDV